MKAEGEAAKTLRFRTDFFHDILCIMLTLRSQAMVRLMSKGFATAQTRGS